MSFFILSASIIIITCVIFSKLSSKIGIPTLLAFILLGMFFGSDGLAAVFLVAIALISYAIPALIEGNGYLSVYITGIILGTTGIKNKRPLVHFFD